MARRVTVPVATVLDQANRFLALTDNEYVNAKWRDGVAALLEFVLHETGNYAGYCGLETDTSDPDNITFGDESRRQYFAKS